RRSNAARPRRRRANGGERCGDSRSVGSGRTNRAGREATHQSRLVAGAFATGRDRRRYRQQDLPLLPGRVAPDRRGQERAAGHRAGAVPGPRHPPSEIRLPALRRWCRAGSGTRATDRRRHADGSHHRPGPGVEICRPPAPVLDPGRGCTKTGQLWAYAADDRPWGGCDPPGAVYVYAPDRKSERPITHLEGFKGILQVDGYAGYRKLADRGDVRLAFCWSHVRRGFYELAVSGPAPIASEALQRIAGLYAIEKDVRGRSPEERRTVRSLKSRPL